MFLISWNSSSPLKYKCIFIIRKSDSVGGNGLKETHTKTHFVHSNIKTTGFTRMLLEENSLLFWA